MSGVLHRTEQPMNWVTRLRNINAPPRLRKSNIFIKSRA
jgi:hypothetical protein